MDPNAITYFGETDSRNKKIRFGIKAKDRLRHMYVIGKTGMGKSTLLENLAIQDIQNGEGIAFIDPHGGTAEKLLDYVPEHRLKDVLYFAPFDMEYPVSFNVLEDIGADKRHLVVNGLMSTFEKIWVDAWSARMAYILSNTLLALLEYPGSTLLGVNRMLTDKEYRKKVVENIKDPSVKTFWVDEFGKWTEKFVSEAIPAIQNKVGQFTANPLVRNLLGQPQSSFDIRKFMDERKILIINMSKGLVGEGNARLIGSMLITKIYLAAMSRADKSEAEIAKLPNFYLYVDEFQSFANKSFADILSEARKYKLSLNIAHQYIEQMEEEVRDAVFGNVGTMVTFRVGAFDAEVLEKEFAPTFTAEDLVNLGFAQIYLKLMIDGVSSQPFSATGLFPIARPAISFKAQAIARSREQYARPRAEVEKQVMEWHGTTGNPGQAGAGANANSNNSKPNLSQPNPSGQSSFNLRDGNNNFNQSGNNQSSSQSSNQNNSQNNSNKPREQYASQQNYRGQSENQNRNQNGNFQVVNQAGNQSGYKNSEQSSLPRTDIVTELPVPKIEEKTIPLVENTPSQTAQPDPNKLAFMEAAKIILDKQKQSNSETREVSEDTVKTENHTPVQAAVSVPPPPSVSLHSLKQVDTKNPSHQNVSNLKNAIADALKKQQDQQPTNQTQNSSENKQDKQRDIAREKQQEKPNIVQPVVVQEVKKEIPSLSKPEIQQSEEKVEEKIEQKAEKKEEEKLQEEKSQPEQKSQSQERQKETKTDAKSYADSIRKKDSAQGSYTSSREVPENVLREILNM